MTGLVGNFLGGYLTDRAGMRMSHLMAVAMALLMVGLLALPNLRTIQGAAQAITVLASAVGPLLLAEWVERAGSYAGAFYLLAVTVGLLALAAWAVRVPGQANTEVPA